MTVPTVFSQTLQQTQEWLKVLMETEGLVDERRAYAALRATLQQLRDRLSVEEAADLGAQLPLLVRGVFFEGWHPAGKPDKTDKEEFIEGVRHKLRDHEEIDPEIAVPAVFKLLSDKVTAGEIEDVKQMLPKHLRALWPETGPAH